MSVVDMQELSSYKLKHNFSSGVSLEFTAMLVYLFINLIGRLISFAALKISDGFILLEGISSEYVIETVLTLMLSAFLLMPLRLNIKGWYQSIKCEHIPLSCAFSYFSSPKYYFSALFFCIIRFIVLFITFLIPQIPVIILWGVLRYGFNSYTSSLGAVFGVLAVITVILAVLGLIFSIYYAIGFFFADFIYVKGISRNPFKALILSRKISAKNRRSLFYTIGVAFPYYLLCIFIISIPFVLPKIRTLFAVYTDDIL